VGREYRSRLRILLDLLRALAREPGIGSTRLLAAANLSTDRLQGYLAEMRDRGLLLERDLDGRRAFELSETGRRLLVELERIDRFMGDFGMSL